VIARPERQEVVDAWNTRDAPDRREVEAWSKVIEEAVGVFEQVMKDRSDE
jgi:hypothetical protein